MFGSPPLFAHRDRAGCAVEDADMVGPTLVVSGTGVSHRRRPRLPMRLMVALLYLKHGYNESDESVVQRWARRTCTSSSSAAWSTSAGPLKRLNASACQATSRTDPRVASWRSVSGDVRGFGLFSIR